MSGSPSTGHHPAYFLWLQSWDDEMMMAITKMEYKKQVCNACFSVAVSPPVNYRTGHIYRPTIGSFTAVYILQIFRKTKLPSGVQNLGGKPCKCDECNFSSKISNHLQWHMEKNYRKQLSSQKRRRKKSRLGYCRYICEKIGGFKWEGMAGLGAPSLFRADKKIFCRLSGILHNLHKQQYTF